MCFFCSARISRGSLSKYSTIDKSIISISRDRCSTKNKRKNMPAYILYSYTRAYSSCGKTRVCLDGSSSLSGAVFNHRCGRSRNTIDTRTDKWLHIFIYLCWAQKMPAVLVMPKPARSGFCWPVARLIGSEHVRAKKSPPLFVFCSCFYFVHMPVTSFH